ncbi:MAG: hypothetical protein GX817_03380 [Elusimicrobia bacterium]|nr:hypothetical protein [Elusimicrobiota bacterium]
MIKIIKEIRLKMNIRHKMNKGQTMVEFLILMPLLVLLFHGVVFFGIWGTTAMRVNMAARAGFWLEVYGQGGGDAKVREMLEPLTGRSLYPVSIKTVSVSSPGDSGLPGSGDAPTGDVSSGQGQDWKSGQDEQTLEDKGLLDGSYDPEDEDAPDISKDDFKTDEDLMDDAEKTDLGDSGQGNFLSRMLFNSMGTPARSNVVVEMPTPQLFRSGRILWMPVPSVFPDKITISAKQATWVGTWQMF